MQRIQRIQATATTILLSITGLSFALLGLAALSDGWAYNILLDMLGINPASPPTPDWHYNLQIFGRDMLFRGIMLLLAFVWLILPHRTQVASLLRQRTYILPAIAISMLLLCWLPVVVTGFSAIIGDTRYWWIFDDGMISMRYAYNLAHGHGLVWNPGERIEGYTNMLWVLYMALVHLLPIPITTTSLVIIMTNIVIASTIIPLLLHIVRMLDGTHMARVAVVVGYVFSLNFMAWATGGAETVLISFLFLVSVALLLRDIQRQQPTPITYVPIGLMTLVRSDAIVLAAALYGVAFILHTNRRQVIRYSFASALLPIAHILFRLAYYGEILPNTAHLKVTNWDNRVNHGIGYVIDFANDYAFLLIFALIVPLLARSKTQILLSGALLGYMAYVAYAGGDVFEQYRFLVPIIPLILVLAFSSMHTCIPWYATRVLVCMLCLISIPLTSPGYTVPIYPHHVAVGNIKMGLILNENMPPDQSVADFWAGQVFYYSHVRGIDLLGKNDPYIARMPALYGDIPGHNKFDFDYSLGVLQPDVVNTSFTLPIDEEELRAWQQSAAPWRGELYFNKTFQEHCLPYPIEVSTWRTMFACDWSPQALHRTSWVVPFEETQER